jgi:hypothetical protein
MSRSTKARLSGLLLPIALFLGLAGLLVGSGVGVAATSQGAKPNRYIGADKCKNCHKSEETGDQFGHWMSSMHAKAFETLATPEAKAAAAERSIEDPQKSDGCVKCHVTAFGLPEEAIKKGFDRTMGVQCESCHGPGEEHMKARMTAVAKGEIDAAVPAGEVVTTPPMQTCRGCHNAESPTYKPFCYYDRVEQIRHLNPKKHTQEELDAMLVCGCEPCTCDEEELESCPVPRGSKEGGK